VVASAIFPIQPVQFCPIPATQFHRHSLSFCIFPAADAFLVLLPGGNYSNLIESLPVKNVKKNCIIISK